MRLLIIIFISFLFTFCKKKREHIIEGPLTVIKGCEGTYLRLNDLDYGICNEGVLDKYEHGRIVKATMINSKDCISDRIRCMMVHGHATADGLYEIKKVN